MRTWLVDMNMIAYIKTQMCDKTCYGDYSGLVLKSETFVCHLQGKQVIISYSSGKLNNG